MLSMYTSSDIKFTDWDEFLASCTLAYNSSRHSVTQKTPFILLYGVEALLPIDTVLPQSTTKEQTRDDQILNVDQERQEGISKIHEAQMKVSDRVNQHRREVLYSPDYLVRVFVPFRKVGLSEKLLHRYCGPYEIISQTSPVNYKVRLIGKKAGKIQKTDIVPVNRLKPFCAQLDPEGDWEVFDEEIINDSKSDQVSNEQTILNANIPPEFPSPEFPTNRPIARAFKKLLAAQKF